MDEEAQRLVPLLERLGVLSRREVVVDGLDHKSDFEGGKDAEGKMGDPLIAEAKEVKLLEPEV